MARLADALTIIVGYDGSDAARRGLAHVGRLAADARHVIVVAVTPEMSDSSMGAELLAGREFDAEQVLDEAAQLLADTDGAAIERRAAVGDPAEVLVEVAREVRADLIIVGRRGSDFVTRTLLGSVAERVVQRASCDVLVVA